MWNNFKVSVTFGMAAPPSECKEQWLGSFLRAITRRWQDERGKPTAFLHFAKKHHQITHTMAAKTKAKQAMTKRKKALGVGATARKMRVKTLDRNDSFIAQNSQSLR